MTLDANCCLLYKVQEQGKSWSWETEDCMHYPLCPPMPGFPDTESPLQMGWGCQQAAWPLTGTVCQDGVRGAVWAITKISTNE